MSDSCPTSQEISLPLIRAAGGIVYRKTDNEYEVILVGSGQPIEWRLPKGIIEPEESVAQAALREIREELNVDIEVERFFETVQYEYSEKIVLLNFYFCRYLRGEAQALGCRQCKWVPLRELGGYPFPPANEPILQKLLHA